MKVGVYIINSHLQSSTRAGAGIAEHACITERFFQYHIMFS